MNLLESFALKIKIEIERFLVHSWRIIRGFPLKKSVILTENIFVGGQFRISKIHRLKEWGVTAVLSMRTHYPKSLDNQSLVHFLNLPTSDRQAPALTHLHQGVDFIRQNIADGGKVYIHCQFGEGRGPTMAAAYLISQGMSVDDAVAVISKVRSFLRITLVQQAQLEAFAIEISTKNSS